MRVSRKQQRQLGLEATPLLRAADRRKRAVAERVPPPKARPPTGLLRAKYPIAR